MPKGRVEQELMPRFLAKVKEMGNGCQEWQSTLHRDGYGKFWFKGSQIPAHRMAYILFNGEIPKGQWVLHKCDNRKCVNPKHLFLGNRIDNINDMDKKQRRGTKSTLKESQVSEIKKLLDVGISQQKIATLFNVHQTAISRIKLDKTRLFLKG